MYLDLLLTTTLKFQCIEVCRYHHDMSLITYVFSNLLALALNEILTSIHQSFSVNNFRFKLKAELKEKCCLSYYGHHLFASPKDPNMPSLVMKILGEAVYKIFIIFHPSCP